MLGMANGDATSQALLFPLTLHLAPAEWEAYEEHSSHLAKLGFQAEPFGGHALAV